MKHAFNRAQLQAFIEDAGNRCEIRQLTEAIAAIKDDLPLSDRVTLQKQLWIRASKLAH